MKKEFKRIIAGITSATLVVSTFAGINTSKKINADETVLTLKQWKFTHQGVNTWGEPDNVGIIESVSLTETEETLTNWPLTSHSEEATGVSNGFDMTIKNTGWNRDWGTNTIEPSQVRAEMSGFNVEKGHLYRVTFKGWSEPASTSEYTSKYCYVDFNPSPFGELGMQEGSDGQIISLGTTESTYSFEFINWMDQSSMAIRLLLGAFGGKRDFAGNEINIHEESKWKGTVHIRDFDIKDLGYTSEYEEKESRLNTGSQEEEEEKIVTQTPYSGVEYTNDYAKSFGYTGGDLVWSDEFSSTSLNDKSWNIETGGGGWGNEEKQIYTTSEKNLYIADISDDSSSDDGKALAIHAQRDGTSTYTSARIQTSGKHSFKYGRMEARIRFDNGMCRGVWPAFWMLGDKDPMGWPYCGEIDIMEHKNADTNILSTLHWNNGDDSKKPYEHDMSGGNAQIPGGSINDWHVYAVDWTSTKMIFYIDDVKIATVKISDSMKKEFTEHEHYFVLNMAIGGNFIGGAIPSSSWEGSTMYVDYVRAYQNKSKVPEAKNSGTWDKDGLWENEPETEEPTTEEPTTEAPTVAPTTEAPTVAPTTEAPTVAPTTEAPTVAPTTEAPTVAPTTVAPTAKPVETTKVTPATTKAIKVTVGKSKVKSAKRSKDRKKIKLTFKKVAGVDGYEYKISTSSKFKKKLTKTGDSSKTTKTVKKLNPKKKYYIKVRAYILDNDGQATYSGWSKVKKVK